MKSSKILRLVRFLLFLVAFVFILLAVCLPVVTIGEGEQAVDTYLFGAIDNSLASLLVLLTVIAGSTIAIFAMKRIYCGIGTGLALAGSAFILYTLIDSAFTPFSTLTEITVTLDFGCFAALITVVLFVLVDLFSVFTAKE